MQLSRYLRQEFGLAYHFWVGFYNMAKGLVPEGKWMGEHYLTLGPHASDADHNGHGCSIIPFLKGACGYAARNQKTVIIPNTQAWTPDDAAAHKTRGKTVEGIIHCSTKASSEIVVPVFSQGGKGRLIAVLDIDSSIDPVDAATFDTTDQDHLETLLRKYFP